MSSAPDGSIALTDGHLDMVCMSKYMYKSLYGFRSPNRGLQKAIARCERASNVLCLYLVFIPGSESSAAANSESLSASDAAGSTADKASSERESIRQKSRTARRTWLILKFHAIWHLATSIRLFGRLVRSEGGVSYCAVSANRCAIDW